MSKATKSIGFRCWSNRFAFVVLAGTQENPSVLAHGHKKAPVGHDRSETLAWLRIEVMEILESHSPNVAAFRATEAMAQSKDMERGQFEGVLIEAAYSHATRLRVDAKRKATIKKNLGLTQKANDGDINACVSHEALAAIPKTNCSEACIIALCGLLRSN